MDETQRRHGKLELAGIAEEETGGESSQVEGKGRRAQNQRHEMVHPLRRARLRLHSHLPSLLSLCQQPIHRHGQSAAVGVATQSQIGSLRPVHLQRAARHGSLDADQYVRALFPWK